MRGSNAIFNGSTLNVTIDAIVARVDFSGGVFNYQSSFEQTGTSTTNGAGGCTFNAPISIKKSGAAYLTMGVSSSDIFNSTLKVINTATYAVQLGYNTSASFYDSLIFENSSSSGISIGGGNANGGGHIYNSKKIAIGAGGFTAGLLTLKNFVQTGTGQQSFVTTGSAITSLAGCSFEGDLTITSPGILLKTSTFNGTTEFIRSSTSSSYSDGGNVFNGTTTFRNNATNSASFRLGVQTGDQYNGNVSFITTTGYIQPAYSGTSEFKGNVSMSSSLVVFNVGTGKLLCTGTSNQTFSTSGSLTYLVSKFGVNKSSGIVTFNAPITIDSLLELTSGNIITSNTNLLTLKVAATVSGGSLNSFVAGPIKKIGNTSFKFPVGKGVDYRPVTISAPSTLTDAFTAEYFNSAQTNGSTKDTSINYISDCNYWNVTKTTGSSNVALTFNWYKSSCDVFDIDSTKLARWNGTKWVDGGLMSYSGNDSIGAVTTTAALSTFGNFLFGHKLIPQLNFDFVVDSINGSTNVVFNNKSKGLAPNAKCYWAWGDSINGVITIDTTLFINKIVNHTYMLPGIYNVKLFVIDGGDTVYFSNNLKIQTTVTIDAHVVLPKSHSTINPPTEISGCYDIVRLNFDILNLSDNAGSTEEIKIIQSAYSQNFATISNANFTYSPGAGSGTVNYSTPGVVTLDAIGTVSGTLSVELTLNTCNIYDPAINSNFFDLAFTLTANTAFQDLSLNNASPLIDATGTGNVREILMPSIAKPKLTFDKLNSNPFLSHDNKEFPKYRSVERYYDITAQEGISDMFSLNVKIEPDINVEKLEIVNDLNVNLYTIFNDPANPLVGGSVYDLLFISNSLITSGSVANLPTVNVLTALNPLAKISLNSCTSDGADILIKEGVLQNHIRIKETVKIISVNNCVGTVNLIGNSEYNLTERCDKSDFNILPCTDPKVEMTLNLKCNLPSNSIVPEMKTRAVTGNNVTYSGFSVVNNDIIEPCSASSSSNSQTDFTILIKNNSAITDESTTIKLQMLSFFFNSDLFEFDHIEFGSMPVNYTLINKKIEVNLESQSVLMSNPNFFNTSGVENQYNVNYPVTPGLYLYLPQNHEIGLSLVGLKLKNCSSKSNDLNRTIREFSLTENILVTYTNMCDIESDLSFIGQSSPDFLFSDALDLQTKFDGYVAATAKPLDLTTNILTSELKYSFFETSQYNTSINQFPRYPWRLFSKNQPNTYSFNFMDCPDLEYYVSIKMPLPIFQPLYAEVIDEVTGQVIATAIAPTSTLNVGRYEFHWPQPSPNSPNIKVKITIALTCDNSFGISDFPIEFRSKCKSGCDDCFILYGQGEVSLHRHCYGICPDYSYISTSNFVLERKTKGWENEADYLSGLTPNANDLLIDKERVYPCDEVHMESTDGYSSGLGANGGIPNIQNLYFDMHVKISQLSTHYNGPNLPLFSGMTSGTMNKFVITPTKGVYANIPFDIPINYSTDFSSAFPSTYVADYDLMRITLNKLYNISYGGSTFTALDLLATSECEIAIYSDLIVGDLNIPNGPYILNCIRGGFSFEFYPPSLPLTFIGACDPYVANLKYLKTEMVVESTLTGPTNPFSTTTQCNLVYDFKAYVKGGYPNADDFPNEYRPVIAFPEHIHFEHQSGLSFQAAVLQNEQYYLNNYTLVGSTATSFDIDLTSSLFSNTMERDGFSSRRFLMFLNRDCGITPDVVPPLPPGILSTNSFNGMTIAGCPSSLISNQEFDALDNDCLDDSKFQFVFEIPQSPLVSNSIPAIHPNISVYLSYQPNAYSSKIQNSWVYFSLTNATSFDLDYKLCYKGTMTEVPYQLSSFLAGKKVYKTGDVLKGINSEFDLYVDWNDCIPLSNGQFDNFKIQATYGNSCKLAGYSINIDDDVQSPCYSYLSNIYEIAPQNPHLSAQLFNVVPSTINDCEQIPVVIEVTSQNADMRVANFIINTPLNGLAINYAQSTVNWSINGVNYVSPLPSSVGIPQALTMEYTWDIIDILKTYFSTNDVHFCSSIDPKLVRFNLVFTPQIGVPSSFVILYNVTAISKCGNSISEATSTSPLINYTGTPPFSFSVNQTGVLCNASNVMLTTTLSGSNYTYLWSNGSTSSSINISVGGLYAVTVTDNMSGCSNYGFIEVIDQTPIVDLVTNSSYCATGNPVTISNATDPQATYNYNWGSGILTPTFTITGALSNPYSVVVTNVGSGCSVTKSITVTDITPSVSVTPVGPVNYCAPQSVSLVASSSPPNSNLMWNNGVNSSSISVSPPTSSSYFVTATYLGCTATSNSVLVNNLSSNASITTSSPFIGYCPPNAITLFAPNDPSYSYTWSNGATTSSIAVSPATSQTYSVTVTNGSCSATSSIFVPNITPSVSINSSGSLSVCPPNSVNLIAYASPVGSFGNFLNYTYQWNGQPGSSFYNAVPTSLNNNQYTVVVTNEVGCSASANINVLNLQPSVTIIPSPIQGCVGSQFVLTGTSNSSSCQYLWSTGSTTNTTNAIVQNPSANYTLTVTDNITGCSNSASELVNNVSPNIVMASTVSSPSPGSSVNISPIISNCVACVYSWSEYPSGLLISSSQNLSVSPNITTSYMLTVTSTFNGVSCSSTAFVNVVVPNDPNGRCSVYGNSLTQVSLNALCQSGANVPSGNFDVNEDLTVNCDITIGAGSNFAVMKDKQITIANGATLFAPEGARFYSCENDMWNGFFLEPGGLISGGSIQMTGSMAHPVYIEDAKIAVEASGTSSIVKIDGNSHIEANNIGIYLHDGEFVNNLQINGLEFSCNKILDAPFSANPYSSIHIKAINAGTINLTTTSSSSYVNKFADAKYCLYFSKTNLTVDGCYFNQNKWANSVVMKLNANNMPSAIYFGGENSWASHNYFLNVGDINSSSVQNKMENFVYGIVTRNRCFIKIEDNGFLNGKIAVDVHNNRIGGVPSSAGSINIDNNNFTLIKYFGVYVGDNNKSSCHIHSNNFNINANFNFNPGLESLKAIYLNNSTPTASNDGILSISDNNILHCRAGIHVMNKRGGSITSNFIYFSVPDIYLTYNSPARRRGVWTNSCDNIAIMGNFISRPNNANYTLNSTMVGVSTLLSGVSEQLSNDKISENYLENLPTNILVSQTCLGTQLRCNVMSNSLEGVKFESAYISDQGDVNTPNGNQWINWPSGTPLINGSLLSFAKWYYNPNFPATNPGMVLPGNLQALNSVGPPCEPQVVCNTCNAERLFTILANSDSVNVDEAAALAAKYYVYRNLKDSMQMMYSGSVYDVQLQNYFAVLGLSSIGALDNVNELLNNNDYSSAYLQNETITTSRLQEENSRIVNRICAQYEFRFEDMDSTDYQLLLSIAYQNPQFGGEAVYRARAILAIDVDDTELSARFVASEIKEVANPIKIFPNPTKGEFILQLKLNETENYEVVIFDNMGKTIQKRAIKYNEAQIALNMSDRPSGLYIIKVHTKDGKDYFEKLILIP